MIGHTIQAARAASLVEKVFVSTDDAEIAAVTERFEAKVIQRPPELATSEASSEAALLHALDVIHAVEGVDPDLLLFLQCTSPLTTSEDLDGLIAHLLAQDAQTAFTGSRFHGFLWRLGDDHDALPIQHDKHARPRRQDREPIFLETGAAYAMRVPGFRRHRHRFFGKTVVYETPAERTLEIDEPEDFERASAILERQDRCASHRLPSTIDAIVFDFDGVMTDDRVTVDAEGVESVTCSRSDGLGLGHLRRRGIPLLVLSKERNPVVSMRCTKLQVPCMQAIDDKARVLRGWLEERGLRLDRTIYLGNDVNDLECIEMVGFGVVVADAHPDIRASAKLILNKPGGRGAVRELCDRVEAHLDGAMPSNDPAGS